MKRGVLTALVLLLGIVLGRWLVPGPSAGDAQARPPDAGRTSVGTVGAFGRKLDGPHTVRAIYEITEGKSGDETIRGVEEFAVYDLGPGVSFLRLRGSDGGIRYLNVQKIALVEVSPEAKPRP